MVGDHHCMNCIKGRLGTTGELGLWACTPILDLSHARIGFLHSWQALYLTFENVFLVGAAKLVTSRLLSCEALENIKYCASTFFQFLCFYLGIEVHIPTVHEGIRGHLRGVRFLRPCGFQGTNVIGLVASTITHHK